MQTVVKPHDLHFGFSCQMNESLGSEHQTSVPAAPVDIKGKNMSGDRMVFNCADYLVFLPIKYS